MQPPFLQKPGLMPGHVYMASLAVTRTGWLAHSPQ